MTTEDDIKADLERVIEILNISKKLAFDSYKMLVTDSSAKHTIISRDKFLTRIQRSFWNLAVIELTKVYGKSKKNDRYSLFFIIDALKSKHPNSAYGDRITIDELDIIRRQLEHEDIEEKIFKVNRS